MSATSPYARRLQRLHRFVDGLEIILRQRARISSRIGKHLVFFVKRLRETECVLALKSQTGCSLPAANSSNRRATATIASSACSLQWQCRFFQGICSGSPALFLLPKRAPARRSGLCILLDESSRRTIGRDIARPWRRTSREFPNTACETNFLIFSSRSTRIASVGVCTRPTVVRWNPPDFELNAVIARVPLMPTSQSDSDRHTAASASGCIA